MLKKLPCLLFSVIFASAMFTGCGTTSNAGSKSANSTTANSVKKLKFGCTVQDLSNPYFVTLVDGMNQKCKEIGASITVVDGKSDAATQVSAVENFIAQKVDAIIIAPVDAKALEPEIKMAHDAKIPVINPCQLINGVDANINLNDVQYGQMGGEIAGQWIKDHLNGKAEVAILGFPQMQALIDRANGLKKGISSLAPNAKIVAEQPANTPETGMKAVETILQAHPNVKVIACTNDAGALGALQAVKAANKDSSDFCIVGLDATDQALAEIRKNGIYRGTVDIDPLGAGKLTIETCVKVIRGGAIKDMVKMQMKKVTIKNIKDYK